MLGALVVIETAAMAAVLSFCPPPLFPVPAVAGEVVEVVFGVVRPVLSSCLVSLACRGGVGRGCSRRAIRFWWWFCRWSSSTLLLRPAVVARGVLVGKLCGGAGGWPGRSGVGGKQGGLGEPVLWLCVFIVFGAVAVRRTAFAVFYRAWRCLLPSGERYGGAGEA